MSTLAYLFTRTLENLSSPIWTNLWYSSCIEKCKIRNVFHLLCPNKTLIHQMTQFIRKLIISNRKKNTTLSMVSSVINLAKKWCWLPLILFRRMRANRVELLLARMIKGESYLGTDFQLFVMRQDCNQTCIEILFDEYSDTVRISQTTWVELRWRSSALNNRYKAMNFQIKKVIISTFIKKPWMSWT